MPRKINFTLALPLLLVLISSCKKDFPCLEPHPILKFVAFTDAETDSIVLKKYVKSSNFSSLVDSTIIDQSNSTYEKSNDTLHIFTANGGDYPLDIQFEYEVSLPAVSRVFKITGITEQQTEIRKGVSLDKTVCINPVISYILDGQTISGLPNYPFIYLDK